MVNTAFMMDFAARRRHRFGLMILLFGLFGSVDPASAAEPGWSPIVLPTGQYRQRIKSMPIEQRPYRPLHFYGNTVRRNYYRNVAPHRGDRSHRGGAMVQIFLGR